MKLAKKEPHGEATRGISNGRIEVPSILLAPVAVDRDNLAATVIADGYQKLEDVYRDVPRDRWPSPKKLGGPQGPPLAGANAPASRASR